MIRPSADSIAGFEQMSVPFGRKGLSFGGSSVLGSTGSSLVPSEENSNGGDIDVNGGREPCNSQDTNTDGSSSGPSHLRLRTALLTSGRAVSNPTFKSSVTIAHRTDSAALPTKPSDDSSIIYTGQLGQQMRTPSPKLVQRMQSDPICSASAGLSSYQLLTRSLSRPPSASNILRLESCDDLTEPSQAKSMSQPQSPDFRPRHNIIPTSPCRLPMKKRKVDWNQLDFPAVSSTSATVVSTCQPTKQPVKQVPSRPSNPPQPSSQNHLVIDCPLSGSGDSLDRKSLQEIASSSAPVDRLPRSLSSHSTLCEDPVGNSSLGHSNNSILLTSSARVRLSDSKDSRSPKLSLLARTLTSVSDLSRPSVQHLNGVVPVPRISDHLRPHQLNASDPCIHPKEHSSGDRFLSKVMASPPAVSLPSTTSGDRWLPISPAPVSKPSITGLIQPTSILLKNNEALRSTQPINPIDGPAPIRPATPSNATRGIATSFISTPSQPRRHSVTTHWDNAQVLMMLSPTNNESSNLHLPADISSLNGTLCSKGASPVLKLGSSTSNFPLLLISASSSAGAEALAAAAAMATGAPPSSLVPVPVQLTAYVPNDSQEHSPSSCESATADAHAPHSPRFMISLCGPNPPGPVNPEQLNFVNGGPAIKNSTSPSDFHHSVPNNSISMSYTAASALAQSNV